MIFNKGNVKVAVKICFILAFLLEMPFNFHVNAHGSQSIQELINSATSGSVVQVPSGTYYENNIEINKSIVLRGAGTIIDGSGGILPIIKVLVSNVTIEGFTIRNTASSQETYGIVLKKVSNVTIRNNNLTKCHTGIRIENSSYCRIVGNQIVSNFAYGLFFVSNASNNVVAGNLIKKNPTGLIIDKGCTLNKFFHNNFIDNQIQISYISYLAPHNKFDNGFEGNYWSDYKGADLNLDGIGDEAYNDLDNYPLMGTFYFIETESQYGFEVISNLTIVDFTYNTALRELRINTEGLNGSVGFCRISIPYALISPPYRILIDGGQASIHYINYSVYSNSTHQWIYFDYYIYSTQHEIVIIPEGLLHIILPTIIIVIVTAVFLKKPYLNLKLKSK